MVAGPLDPNLLPWPFSKFQHVILINSTPVPYCPYSSYWPSSQEYSSYANSYNPSLNNYVTSQHINNQKHLVFMPPLTHHLPHSCNSNKTWHNSRHPHCDTLNKIKYILVNNTALYRNYLRVPLRNHVKNVYLWCFRENKKSYTKHSLLSKSLLSSRVTL